jgi:hypothetical protein
MVTTWLYSVDGRAIYCVAVPLPMPQAVTFNGATYFWSTLRHRYEEVAVAQAQAQAATGAVPALQSTITHEPPPF